MANVFYAKDCVPATWSGGTTTELYIAPKGSSYKERNFLIRISSAQVLELTSTFTDLPKYQRYIATLTGPMDLTIDGQEQRLNPFEVLAFDGGAKTTSSSQETIVDFNFMVAKGTEGTMVFVKVEEELKQKLSSDFDGAVYTEVFQTEDGHFKDFGRMFEIQSKDEIPQVSFPGFLCLWKSHGLNLEEEPITTR